MDDLMQRGIAEREKLRPFRVENYRVKHANQFTCAAKDCGNSYGILVTKVDGELTTRCKAHLEGEVSPGQWNERGQT